MNGWGRRREEGPGEGALVTSEVEGGHGDF
jgi:hypothetical protein